MSTVKEYPYLFIPLLVLWLLSGLSVPALAQTESPSSAVPEGTGSLEQHAVESSPAEAEPAKTLVSSSSYFPFLPSLKETVVPGKIKIDENSLELVYQKQLDNGIRNFTSFALLLMERSRQAKERGESEEAVRLALAGIRCAPDFPQPYWVLAHAYGAGKDGLVQTLKGYAVALKNFRSLLLLTIDIYWIVGLALLLAVFALALVVLFKYFNLLAYDAAVFILRQPQGIVGYFWAGVLVLLPVVFNIGLVLTACYWLIIVAVYATKRERQLSLIFTLLLALLPWGFRNAACLLSAAQPGIVDTLHRANFEDWTTETEGALNTWLSEHPQDAEVRVSLGLIKKRQGDYDEAEKLYKAVLEEHPSADMVIGNLANVYLAKGQLAAAEETARKAVETNPNRASTHYNLYRIYLERYKFVEAREKEQLLTARRLAPELIEFQERIYTPIINRTVIDDTVTTGQLWDQTFASSPEKEALAAGLWRVLFPSVPYRFGAVVFLLFFACILFTSSKGVQTNFSALCSKCGKPIRRRMRKQQAVGIGDFCSQCMSLFIEKRKVDQKAKGKKEAQIERFQRQRRLVWQVLTYVLPGGGHAWVGSPTLAFLFLVVFFGFVLTVVFWNGVIADPYLFHRSGNIGKLCLVAVPFVLFYAVAVRSSQSKENRSRAASMRTVDLFRTKGIEQQRAKGEETPKKA